MLGIKPSIMELGAQDPTYCTDRTAPLPSPFLTHLLPPPHTHAHTQCTYIDAHIHVQTHTCTHSIPTHMEFNHVDVKATGTEAMNYVV